MDPEQLKRDWERRARSSSRDFFVASHPGWDDPEAWARQAAIDTESILLGLDRDALRRGHALEIGCGVGRLVEPLLPLVRSYTGVDIAPGMLEEARRRLAGRDDVRLFESDGTGVPDAARDRDYALVLALAVFIHCPRDMIGTLIDDAWPLLAPGGEFRFQVRADPEDPTGVESPAAAEAACEQDQAVQELVTDRERALIEDTPYMGYRFAYDELRQFLAERTDGEITLFRSDLIHIYASIARPQSP